jgi:hypothetical protein
MRYSRYVDYSAVTTLNKLKITDFNSVHTSLKFTIEKGKYDEIKYLHLTITNWKKKFNFDTYRKPTTTDHIIHHDSCHPFEHKNPAYAT